MKIITWNINSIKTRLPHLLELIAEANPDILLLQELKCETDKFPFDELSHLPYNFYVHGQKSYNGVAVLSKFPADEVMKEFPGNSCKDQSRFIEISVKTKIGYCKIISVYAPNGGEVGSDKFKEKLQFYDNFTDYLRSQLSLTEMLIVGGDLNIAPFDIDVYSPKELKDSTCFTLEERRKLRNLLNSGLEDLYRLASPDKHDFSWWDYRAGCFEQNKGMRIDMILGSSNVVDRLKQCQMNYHYRAKPQPSDHIPVMAVLG